MNYYDDEDSFIKPPINIKRILLVSSIVLVLIIIIIGIITSQNNYRKSYEYYEGQMIASAKKYVKDNNISVSGEIYIGITKLDIESRNNCSLVSGVIYNENNTYKPYLLCNDYESKIIDNSNKNISLNGKEVILLNKGDEYVEPGYSGYKNVKISGQLGSEEGIYDLNYHVIENDKIIDTLTRKIIILDNIYLKGMYPIISLRGSKIEYVSLNNSYIEKGAVALDNTDGDITNNIHVDGDVNVSIPGEYKVLYSITNSQGYAKNIERIVKVVNNSDEISTTHIIGPTSLTNGNVTIVLEIFGNKYDYTILPNGELNYEKSISYVVSDNGIYNFMIVDESGQQTSKPITISNINKVIPKGSCDVSIYPNYSTIDVANDSSNQISGYRYIIDGTSTEYLNSTTYYASTNNITSVQVEIKDIINNVNKINCSIKYMDPSISNNNILYYTVFNDEYVIPKTNNDLQRFVNNVKGRISQSANPNVYGDSCLGFAEYHTYMIKYGNMSSLNALDGYNYRYATKFQDFVGPTKEEVLTKIHKEINAGRPVVLMVNANVEKTSRHFVTVVGYRRSVYYPENLQESDLIIIDAWSGNLRSMDSSVNKNARSMYKQYGNYRLRVFID